MKLLTSLGLSGLLIVLAAACGDDGRRSTGDGGTDGSIMLMDGGGGDTSTRPDTGTGGDGGSCPPAEIPNPTTPVCSNMLIPCIQACPSGDEACATACFDSEDPMCEPCLDQAIGACFTMNGCADSYGQIICCAEAAGCAPTDTACAETSCGTEIGAFSTCTDGVDISSCGPNLGACIMM